MLDISITRIAVVGLGYVGLPLAVEFGKRFPTIGYDTSNLKIAAYRRHEDRTGELTAPQMQEAKSLEFTADASQLATADFIIIAVPTPVNSAHQPDFSCLVDASITVGRNMKRGVTVIYESTVYPGATEEICIPTLQSSSGLKWKKDFYVGYSPERINPSDKEHTLTRILKVVSGDSADTLEKVAQLYSSVVTAGLHRASSIQVAEAAKVIENTQRDINIALMNELALIFNRMSIDTTEVLEAAGTKWNFLKFRPGLVGGHCIGVDPYYLTYKAEMLGYHPEVILAGRRINDSMANYVAKMTVQNMIKQGGCGRGDTVIVLGLAFKEDCPDLRNSKVADLIASLKAFGLEVIVHDPIADPQEAVDEYGLTLTPWDVLPKNVSAIVAAVSHREYLERPLSEILALLKPCGVFSDVKSAFDTSAAEQAGHLVWRL